MLHTPDSNPLVPLQDLPFMVKRLAGKKVTMGFDGFIDSVVRIVRPKHEHQDDPFFDSSIDLANYILEKQSKSFSMELAESTSKLGGNMPIMANALAHLGPELTCIGAFGLPEIHPVFDLMPSNCKLFSFANPGVCMAFEFRENKIMMAEMERLNQVTWETIKNTIGLQKISTMFQDRDLISLLNWSELQHSTDIWKGLLRDVLPNVSSKNKPLGFFDFSDCSKKSHHKIMEALELIKAFSAHWNITLGMNLNEAGVLYSALTNSSTPASVETMGDTLFNNLGISQIIIHRAASATCWNKNGTITRESMLIKEPKIITGAGDNFNAGFCAGMLMELDTDAALSLGHTVSHHYLRYGQSPHISQVVAAMPV